ncbi:MAG: ABC transporter permease [Desulforhopalus sp.]|nr:ABC transporter permease [Desulforhopalus sp.]
MELLFESFKAALQLMMAWDQELLVIVGCSLKVSGLATLFATIIGLPLGFTIAFTTFPGKRFTLTCLNTLLALPTVVIGLLVYTFVSRKGMFGSFGLLYTQKAMIIGQIILIIPVISTMTIAAISRIDRRYRLTALTLGANRLQMAWVIFFEARFGVIAAVIAAYGRVIAEIGISMMLGGNAKGFTRTMTTAMALEYDKGEFVLAVALGMILMGLAFAINLLFHIFQGKVGSDAV